MLATKLSSSKLEDIAMDVSLTLLSSLVISLVASEVVDETSLDETGALPSPPHQVSSPRNKNVLNRFFFK